MPGAENFGLAIETCLAACPSNAFLANLAVNLIVNFIDFRPFSMKFAIKFSTKTSDLGFVG